MAEGSSSLSGIRLFLPSLQNILAAAGRGSRPPTSPCTIQPILQLNVDLPILSPPTPSLAETAECVIGAGWTARTTDGGTGAASENEWRRADGREREMEGRPAGHCGHLELRVSLPARRVGGDSAAPCFTAPYHTRAAAEATMGRLLQGIDPFHL